MLTSTINMLSFTANHYISVNIMLFIAIIYENLMERKGTLKVNTLILVYNI